MNTLNLDEDGNTTLTELDGDLYVITQKSSLHPNKISKVYLTSATIQYIALQLSGASDS